MKIARLVHASALALALAVPAIAAAGPPAASNPAKEHFDAAQSLFDQKKYEAALVLFRQAHEESKSPNAHLMIARCLLALNRLPEAHDELTATLTEAAAKAESEPKYAQARDAAAAELAPLEAKVGKLVLTFSGEHSAARVSVNGVVVPPGKIGVPMAVLPGTVQIVVEGLGPAPEKRSEAVAAGQTRTIVLTAQAAAPAGTGTSGNNSYSTAAPTASLAPGAAPATTGGTVRTVGFIVMGVGLAGGALFGVSAFMAEDKLAQLKKECGTSRCTDPKYAAVIDDGKTFDLLSNIGLGVGIAGLAAGTAMVIFGGPKKVEGTPTATLQVSPSGALLRLDGSF